MENKEKGKQFLKIFTIYFIVLVAFVGIRILANLGIFDGIKNEIVMDLTTTSIIQIGILFLIPFILYLCFFRINPKKMFQDFGYKKLNFKAILICFGIGILAYIVNVFVSNFFAIILNYIGFNPRVVASTSSGYDTFPKFLFGVLSVAILPALFEEFVHRGLILRGTSNLVGYKSAIIISSLLFGLMHLNIQQFFYATILGLLMGFIATITRSIWPAVIVHFSNNFINVFVSYSETTKLFDFSLSGALNDLAKQGALVFFVVSILIVSVALVLMVFLIRKLFMETGIKKYKNMFDEIEKNIRETSNSEMTDTEVVKTFNNYILPKFNPNINPFDFYINDSSGAHYGDLKLKYKISLVSCFVLASLITIFTFIWGVV